MSERVVTIKGGPIANSGYDHLRLAVDHEVITPDGTTSRLPAGTILIMCLPGAAVGYDQLGGAATLAEALRDPRDGKA